MWTDYLLDVQPGLWKVVAADDGTNVNRYLHDITGIAQHEDPSGNWNWMAEDGLGTVRGVYDDTLAEVYTADRDPYGDLIAATGTNPTPFEYTGEPEDQNGLLHLRARYYDPSRGVFNSLDPLETLNRYGYVNGDPVNNADPSGLITWGDLAVANNAVGCSGGGMNVLSYLGASSYTGMNIALTGTGSGTNSQDSSSYFCSTQSIAPGNFSPIHNGNSGAFGKGWIRLIPCSGGQANESAAAYVPIAYKEDLPSAEGNARGWFNDSTIQSGFQHVSNDLALLSLGSQAQKLDRPMFAGNNLPDFYLAMPSIPKFQLSISSSNYPIPTGQFDHFGAGAGSIDYLKMREALNLLGTITFAPAVPPDSPSQSTVPSGLANAFGEAMGQAALYARLLQLQQFRDAVMGYVAYADYSTLDIAVYSRRWLQGGYPPSSTYVDGFGIGASEYAAVVRSTQVFTSVPVKYQAPQPEPQFLNVYRAISYLTGNLDEDREHTLMLEGIINMH